MNGRTRTVITLLAVGLLGACSKKNEKTNSPEVFTANPVSTPLPANFPGEVSGMTDSFARTGNFWTLQDSDNPAELMAVGHDGQLNGKLTITNAVNRDWEDLAMGPGPETGKHYLYISDAGDNNLAYSSYTIYRLEEPASTVDAAEADAIQFVYSDGKPHNTEAILVEPSSKDIYLFTKEKPAAIYVLRYPYSVTETNTAVNAGALKFNEPTGAAISADGQEILVRTYRNIFYWKRGAGTTVESILSAQAPAQSLNSAEPQGESVCFGNLDKVIYTLSENAGLPLQLSLYLYPRK